MLRFIMFACTNHEMFHGYLWQLLSYLFIFIFINYLFFVLFFACSFSHSRVFCVYNFALHFTYIYIFFSTILSTHDLIFMHPRSYFIFWFIILVFLFFYYINGLHDGRRRGCRRVWTARGAEEMDMINSATCRVRGLAFRFREGDPKGVN